jgi:hypothetical protein
MPPSEPIFEIRPPGEADDQLPARSSGVIRADQSTFAARLATKQNLRDAIVLREIFGPPRSLQPVD